MPPKTEKPLIYLASQSMRRRQLLAAMGIDFELVDSEVEEVRQEGETPAHMVSRLARDKAHAGLAVMDARRANGEKVPPGSLLLAADTLVDLDGDSIGKPKSAAEAAEILRSLCGRSHIIMTAVAVADVHSGAQSLRVERAATEVIMREPAPGWIDYCASVPEAVRCAGGYAVQGAAAPLIESYSGCFYAIVGLPMALTVRLLHSFGFDCPKVLQSN